jgi:glucose 1-dehydrogenase
VNAAAVLTGQRALVTGASSGIGRAIARAVAEAGAKVAVNYSRDQAGADAVVADIRNGGGEAIAIRADVGNESDVETLFRETLGAFGGLDLLVSNAGLQKDAAFMDMTLQDWNTVIAVNLTGGFLCAREAAREFKRKGVVPALSCSAGKIIFISSVHDVIPWAGHANYAASKGGLSMLMKTIAQELAAHRVRVNSISPGAIRTPINRSAWETPEALQSLMELIPYGRIGEAEDIARAAVWLASDAAEYVNGATLYIDGGMTLYPAFRSGG